MCGLTGYVSRDPGNAAPMRQQLPGAIRALHHRGPDDQGLWFSPNGCVGLGHARLSILDLSAHGHQPMVSAEGRLAMVFNGEIYNYADIRRELMALGHRFAGTGDSEVILAAFLQWGVQAAVSKFIGMFAIALWDTSSNKLTLIRDRLGVKPLYYGWDGKTCWFGSELKALRGFEHWQPQIDTAGLADYFQFGYINAPRSIYRHVLKLPPGHWLELSGTGEPVIRPYWSVLDSVGRPLSGSEDELAEQLEALMVDAFKLRMVSDVPVGMFLSGGIDSSLVTALLQKHHGNIHTFTIGFNEASRNEAPHARRIAEHLGTHHTERILETAEARQILPQWGSLYDEPFADDSGIPTYLVSKMASEQVKVVLSADGGDELFSGYTLYGGCLDRWEKLQRIPRALRRAISHLPSPTSGSRAAYYRNLLGCTTPGEMYEQAFSVWSKQDARQLAGAGTPPDRALADIYPGNFAEQMCLWDLHNYMPGDILAKVDRATMAVSIEGREPLIDHRIVEFAFRLPLYLRRGSLGSKHLLRKILYKHVPREMVERPKMGFGIPLGEWLRGDLGHLIDDYLHPTEVRNQGLLDDKLVARTVQQFRNGDDRAVNRIWSLLAFQMWREQWV
jgi:asparagine synthase (glutamine-hydrolysing)